MAEHEIALSAVVAEDGSLRLELAGKATLNARSLAAMVAVLQLFRKLLDPGAAQRQADLGAPADGETPGHGAEDRERLAGSLAGAPREQILALAKALGI